MQKIGAYEPVWKFRLDQSLQAVLPVPEPNWRNWLWRRCRVRGQVVKAVTPGGPQLPVCHARVHLCEVDRWFWIIRKLPDQHIIRLRDELVAQLARPFPVNPNPPDPPFRVNPIFERQAISSINDRISAVALNPQPLPPLASVGFQSLASRVSFNPQPDPPGLTALPVQTRAALTSDSTILLRQTLLENINLIRPYLCLWPWLWWWFTCDEFAVVETDEQGRFDASYWYLLFSDQPDIYVWVEYNLDGVWTTVYRPNVACHTYWNYVCGSEVTIALTDPRVPVCDNRPRPVGNQVVFSTIGNNISLTQIQSASAGGNEGLITDGSPFGGTLELRTDFGTGLATAGISYYRWSYHRLTLSNGTSAATDPDWHHLNRRVIRHYRVEDAGGNPSYPTELIGPLPAFPGLDLYKIEPDQTPVIKDAHEDLVGAFFETEALSATDPEAVAGKYELKLELFNSAGNPVNLTDAGVGLHFDNQNAPFGTATVTTAPATEEHLIRDGAGKIVAFRMVVRVDNNPCSGTIFDASINGQGAGPCGFLNYPAGTGTTTSTILSFRASHPHNFATFTFEVARGSSGILTGVATSGVVGINHAPYTEAAGVYSHAFTVNELLNANGNLAPAPTPPCDKGAFAESLHVSAMAYDGWVRLSNLDAPRAGESGLNAFAIAPIMP